MHRPPRLMAAPGLVFLLAAFPGCGGSSSEDPVALRGKTLYDVSCAACHQPDGAGKEGVALSLVDSSWVQGPEGRLVRIALHGVRGPIEVHGKSYNLEMPGFQNVFGDEEMAAVLTYLRQAWGNRAPSVSAASVAAIRAAHRERGDSWTAAELLEVEG
jgi:mono/diheme cytochrome c family protein